MAEETREQSKLPSPGPYLAEVTNHLDPTYMGCLEVALIKGIPSAVNEIGDSFVVKYLSPFAGNTSVRFEGNKPDDFNSVQKSYGFWMIPPDVGSTVMVIFVDGDPQQGYWFGCAIDPFQNHMIPGIAASRQAAVSSEQLNSKYGTDLLPVAEFHKKSSKERNLSKVDKLQRPVHPFADRLIEQGLLLDVVRGVTSSSARREVPSGVFGISTPGPLDTRPGAPKGDIGFKERIQAPVSRLGGTTFVMDDGDIDGQNELVRLRTRTGHQILLHNSQDLIYIANSKGTAWIEMTSSGKIDIYAKDSVSIHTEADFNFRADRDVNIEAGRDIHMKAYGGIDINCELKYNLICNKDGKIYFAGSTNLSTGQDLKIQCGESANILADDIKLSSAGTMNLGSNGAANITSGGDISIGASGTLYENASNIHMNGPSGGTAATAAAPELPKPLEIFSLPNRKPSSGWNNKNFYKAEDIKSILQRVPTHEPWPHHESIDPEQFTSDNTDVVVTPPPISEVSNNPQGQVTTSTQIPVNTKPVSPPISKNAKGSEAYLQSVLIAGGVTSPIKLAAWMAQCKVESGGFIYTRELGAESYFAKYEKAPLAKGLGNTQPGDGARFKGRGYLQLTGRASYTSMTSYFKGPDFVQQPEIVEGIEWASRSVLYFFNVFKPKGFKNDKMTQKYTDTDAFWSDTRSVTGLVNGGLNHYNERKVAYDFYLNKFQTQGIAPDTTAVKGGPGSQLAQKSGDPVKRS